MQHLNLVDERLLPPRPRPPGAVLLVGFGLALTLVVLHGAFERHRLASAIASAPEAATEDAPAEAPSQTLLALQQRVAQRRALLDTLETAQALPHEPADALEGVLAAVPDAAWLTEVDLQGARGLRIAGGVLEPAALLPLSRRLSHLPTLRGAPIGTLRLTRDNGPDAGGDAAAPPLPSYRFVLASQDAAEEGVR